MFAQKSHVDAVYLGSQYGFVYAHTIGVQNTTDSRPLMIQAAYERYNTDTNTFDKWHCFPHHGILFTYTQYQLPVLGESISLAYYLQPDYHFSNKYSVGLRAIAGASWNSKGKSNDRIPENQSYSEHMNAYLGIGLHSGILITPAWELNLVADFNHISNGGWSKPNKGINWVTSGIGIKYFLDRAGLPDYSMRIPRKIKKQFRAGMSVFHSYYMISSVQNDLYPVSGLSVTGSYYGILSGWTAGTEFTYDKGIKEQEKLNSTSPNLFSVTAGHEFILGKFIFSQQLGYYYYKQNTCYSSFYHRWGLEYYPIRKLGVGINMKVHGETANFLDARLVYLIKK